MSRPVCLAFGFLFSGCAAPAPRPPTPPPPVEAVSAEVEGDRAFTGPERAAIARAADRLRSESRGCVSLVVEYDSPRAWQIVRRLDTDTETRAADAKFKVLTLGWTDPFEVSRVIVDRHHTDHALEHTVEHELLHLVGVRHASGNPRAIMAPSADADEAPLELAAEDREQIHSALGCVW